MDRHRGCTRPRARAGATPIDGPDGGFVGGGLLGGHDAPLPDGSAVLAPYGNGVGFKAFGPTGVLESVGFWSFWSPTFAGVGAVPGGDVVLGGTTTSDGGALVGGNSVFLVRLVR